MGVRNIEPVNGGGDWIITKADHWMFAGTGVKNGDAIPGLIGWEYHGRLRAFLVSKWSPAVRLARRSEPTAMDGGDLSWAER